MEKKKIFIIILLFAFFVNFEIFGQVDNIKDIRSRAYAGDAKAMIELSNYYKNKGKNELAKMWLDKAQKKEPEAVMKIKKADAVEKEINSGSLKACFKYAYENNPHAMIVVGNSYDNGEGVDVDKDEALKWYRKAQAIDESLLFKYINLKGEASRLIMSEIANKGNTEAMIRLGETSSSDAEAHKWYKMAAAKGDRRGKQKSDELYAQRKAEQAAEEAAEEAAEGRRTLYRSTFRDMAGYWTCSNSYTQFWITSDGRAYFRNGSGYAWEELGVKYMDYYKIRVYDAHAVHYLKLKGNQLIQDDTYVYYRR